MKLALVGSPTLKRFTEGILKIGFQLNGCEIVSELAAADLIIIQIHGAPAAREADLEIIKNLPELSKFSRSIILLHRPDEIRDSIPNFKAALASLPPTTGLVMLGDLVVNDPFYDHPQLEVRVIPHGFFDIDSVVLTGPIVVGSHTTWGEMRSIESVLLLLNEITEAGPNLAVIGYLGGGPAESLSLNSVAKSLDRLSLINKFVLREVEPNNWTEQLSAATPKTIFIHTGVPLYKFDVTFNAQLYYYGKRVRIGESSGSIHASAGIPVILEMNGSERIEQLEVVKVPYSDAGNVKSADLSAAARQIVDKIGSNEYLQMLRHNRMMAYKWRHQEVAKLYLNFFNRLADNRTVN
jgi:hypothetical protein